MRIKLIGAAMCAMVIGTVALSVSAVADGTAETKKAIQAQYDKMDAALAKKDLSGYVKFCSKDFVNIDEKGQKAGLEATKAQMKQIIDASTAFKSNSAILKLTAAGKSAIVRVKQHVACTINAPGAPAPQKLVIDAESEDTWNKTGSGWLIAKSKTISQNVTPGK